MALLRRTIKNKQTIDNSRYYTIQIRGIVFILIAIDIHRYTILQISYITLYLRIRIILNAMLPFQKCI